MRRLLANRFVLALLVLLALGGLYGIAGLSHPVAVAQSTAPRLSRATVSSAVRACPAPGSAGATSGGVAIAAAPAATAGPGQAAVSRLTPTGSATVGAALRTFAVPGKPTVAKVPAAPAVHKSQQSAQNATDAVPTFAGRGGVMVTATASMSQGLEVEQTGSGGLATARCNGPGTDFWFVGPGQESAAHIQLYLMNVDGQQADAQVTALTDSGPLLGNTDAGIVVPPHGMVIQSLGKLLHKSRFVALHVSTTLGRVVAAVRETKSTSEPGGWLPVTQAPAKRLVLPGLPGTAGTRELYVVVPGSGDAQVKLTAVTPKGSYQPTGGSGIDLPGGSAAGVPLPSLSGIPAAVEISSNVPVTAAIMVPGGAAGSPGAITAAAGPVQQQGVLAANPGSAAGSAELVLSAPRAAASVLVTVATSASAFAGQTGRVVAVAAGHTLSMRVRPPPGTPRTATFAVLITVQPGSGPVYAGRVISTGSGVQSILPVDSSLIWIPLPVVHDSLTTVLH